MATTRGNVDTIDQTQPRLLSGGSAAAMLLTTDGSSLTTGNLLKVDASGNAVDSGVAASGVGTVTSVAGRTGAVTLAESDTTGLVSDLAAKAPLASPTFTGTPSAPTPSTADNSTKLATTAYVQAQGFLGIAPLVVGFSMSSGATGTGLAYAVAPRAGTVSKCKILVKSSDGSTDLTFKIKKNGTNVFSSDPTVTHGASAGALSTSTSLTSSPLTVAADDILSLDITSGTASWAFTAQLES